MEAVEKADEPGGDAGQARENADGERPVEEAQRVENPHDVQREHGAHQDEDEDVVLPGDARLFLLLRPEELRLLEDEGEELVDGPQRTDPAADDPPQDDRQEDGHPGQGERGEKCPGGEERRQRDERVEMEEPLHRPADVVLPRVVADGEKIHEQAEEPGLRRDAQDLKNPVFPRLFFFQCAASPVRICRGPAPGPAAGKAAPAA